MSRHSCTGVRRAGMLRAILTVSLHSASVANGGATTQMTRTWIKRGSAIELLDGDPPTRSTSEFEGEEQFLFENEPLNFELDYGSRAGRASPSNRTSAEYVRWVQRSLNRIMGLRLDVDGVIGPMTRSAIRGFQQRNGLLVDGIVGPQTEGALIAAGASIPPWSAGPYPPVQPRTTSLTQKALYLERLRKRTGHAYIGSTAIAFEFNNPGWRNRIQLEALVEFFMNFTDPWLSRPPYIPGVNEPRSPGSGYITVDLRTGWHLILVDSFGGRLTGYAATAAGNVVTLDGLTAPSKINRNFDTIYLPNDTARASKTYRITAVDDVRRTVTLDGRPTFTGGSSRWHIPAGVSGQLAPLVYDLGPGRARGFDHFDGAMFIVKDGVVHRQFRWTSYTSRNYPEGHRYLSSLRGNKRYDFSSFRSGNAFRNYCFKVNDVGAAGAACDCVREARFYFTTPVTRDVDGKTEIRIHHAQPTNPNGGCGSAGCIVSAGSFYDFRHGMINLFQRNLEGNGGTRDAAMDRLLGADHATSGTIWKRTEGIDRSPGPTVTAAEWNNRITGTLWLVRPDERALPLPFVR